MCTHEVVSKEQAAVTATLVATGSSILHCDEKPSGASDSI